MKMRAILIDVLVGAFAMLVQAQTAESPKPGPEHKKLSVFLGSWSVDTEVKADAAPGRAGGKLSYVDRYEWMPGEMFLQMHRDGQGPGGEIKQMFILGYDPVRKTHTRTGYFLRGGGSSSGTLTNTGNTWVWSGSGYRGNGTTFQDRCTITVIPNTSITSKCESSSDGKTWSPPGEVKATRVNP